MLIENYALHVVGNNGIGSLARELGLESINVHTPSESKRYFPPK